MYMHTFEIKCSIIPSLFVFIFNIKDGSVGEEDLFSFLSDADFPSLDSRPKTWKESVLALRNEMANHVVIRCTASLFSVDINVIDWNGVSIVIKLPLYPPPVISFLWRKPIFNWSQLSQAYYHCYEVSQTTNSRLSLLTPHDFCFRILLIIKKIFY